MMNTDAIDEHNYMQYNLFINPDQNHYLPEDTTNHMAMSHLEDTSNNSQSSIHSYMHSNSANKQLSSNANLNSMHQSYTHGINAMDSHNRMLNSPQMIQQIDQNSTNNQMNYCKVPSTAISNHFETPPLPHAYHQQNIRNHQSPNNNASDLNHFNQKYCADSNESSNVSNTLTHISETDNSNSHNNYAPTPPQTQPIVNKYSNIGNLNLISTPQTYTSMACHPSNDWNTIPANLPDINPQIKCLKNSNSNQTSYENESRYSYLNQRSSDYHQSITSTPVSLQSSNDNYRNRTSKNINNNQYCLNQDKTNSYSNDLLLKKSKLSPNNNNNSEMLSNSIKKDCICAEKRNIIIFKVVEQILEPSTKRILKETVIKNEEIISSCGQVQFDALSNDTITSSENNTPSIVGSSGLLADISGLSNSKSVNNLSSTNSIEFSNNAAKNNSYFETSNLNKSRSKLKTPEPKLDDIPPIIKEEKLVVSQANSVVESDEEERRQTASALLSLQSVSNNNTPVKNADGDEECPLSTSTKVATALSSGSALLSDIEKMSDTKLSGQYLPLCAKLRPGIKVMAKWKDKNFYPAVLVKQLESHKWSVKFEDSANRNLFETELIRIEHLLVNQDVMVTISDLCMDDGSTICIPATIKKIHSKNDKKIEFDTEHFDKDKSKVVVRHQLKDIFLNVEQSNAIQAKVSKPTTSAAVFADVDLDNIVVGKRSRSVKQANNEASASTLKKKMTECSVSDSNSKKKKKTNDDTKKPNEPSFKVLVDTPKKNDFQIIGHYHESSLSVSPRMAKSSISMPTNELEKILGPVPKVNSKLFDKMGFMLTSGDRNKNIFSEQESNPERSIPFDKTYLTKQIISGGGKVYDTFEEMKSSNDNLECVLIADTYHRSIKYIQCLAAGIPIASHLWVIDSCRANKLIERDSYILPAGYSVITHALSSDKNTLKKSSVLFKGVKFYFGSKSADKLEKLWTPVLFAAQAIIVKQDSNMHNTLSKKSVDIIIGDASCSAELIKKAKQVKIPVISSEYIVQCLINGRKLSYDACPFFSYSYK